MKKLALLVTCLVALVVAVIPGTAQATNPDPPTLFTTCGAANTFYISPAPGTHTGHRIYRAVQAHDAQPWNGGSAVHEQSDALNNHSHTWYEAAPQVRDAMYWSTTLNGAYESMISDVDTCSKGIRWIAGGETTPVVSGWTSNSVNDDDGEWAEADPVEGGGVAADQTLVSRLSGAPVLKGYYAYRCSVTTSSITTDDRCEWEQGNALHSAEIAPNKPYQQGDDLWLSTAFYLPPGFSFCGSSCPGSKPYDGGAITQEKQLGGCGNPVSTMAVHSSSTGQIYLAQNNSPANVCADLSNPTVSLWEVPIETGRWIKILRHFKFSYDATVGFIESYVDADGNGTTTWDAIDTTQMTSQGLAKTHSNATAPTDIGYVSGGTPERIFTWTTKTTSDQPAACSTPPCTHQRVGVYRNQNINGSSTIYHDGVAAGADSGDVVEAAF